MRSDPLVTIDDIIAAGHCVSGAKRWFRIHGLDFRAFLQNGARASDLLATGDALARQVVDRKAASNG